MSSAASSTSHEEEEHKTSVKNANLIDVFFLGISVVIGGQVFSWNVALSAGFWEGLIGILLTSLMYFCLVLCISEMTSALPFSGGSYGYVRVCIGPFFGYVIGCCETLQNITYVSSAVIPLAQMITSIFAVDAKYEPITWVIFYMTSLVLNIMGRNMFWKFNRVIGIVSLGIIVFYVTSTAQYVEFDKYSGVSDYSFDVTNFIKYLPYCTWFYIGVEGLPLTCVDCEQPSREIPYAMIACMVVLFLTGIGVFFVTISQSPGIEELASAPLPMNYGFTRFFGISDAQATWLELPATYATGFGFMFMYGRQMNSMARSGLFPAIFKARTSLSQSPYTALMFGSLLSVVGVIVINFTSPSDLSQVFFICAMSSYVVYISVFISYILFLDRYSPMERVFRNPLGRGAAVYGIGFCLFSLTSLLGFQDGKQIPLICFMSYLCFLLAFYYFYGYKTQMLSEEELKVLFKAYITNANLLKREKKKNRYNIGGKKNASSIVSNSNHSTTLVHCTNTNTKSNTGNVATDEDRKGFKVIPGVTEDEEECMGDSMVVEEVFSQPTEPINQTTSFPKPSGLNSHKTISLSAITTGSDRETGALESKDEEAANLTIDRHQPPKDDVPQRRNSIVESFFRSSFLHSISDKVQEIIQEMKLVPFMPIDARLPYEEVIIADMRGELPHEPKSSKVFPS